MFKIGGCVYFLVKQRNEDITLECGEIISHDDEIICMTTYVGDDKNKIRFLKKKYAFSNQKDGIDAHDKLHREISKIKKATNYLHVSLFDPKI